MIIDRRSFLRGLMAAPIIVAAPSLMKVRALGDGVMLWNAEHPITPLPYPGDLSDQALQAALIEIRKAIDTFHARIFLKPRRLIVHPSWIDGNGRLKAA